MSRERVFLKYLFIDEEVTLNIPLPLKKKKKTHIISSRKVGREIIFN